MPCLVYQAVKQEILPPAKIVKLVLGILKKMKAGGSDVSVHLIGDSKMKKLNKRYRGKDKTTDVLSFAMENKEDLGDIFISIPQVKRQAKEFKVSEKEEMSRMLAHGVLHLLGRDHEKKREAEKMFALQEKLLVRGNKRA